MPQKNKDADASAPSAYYLFCGVMFTRKFSFDMNVDFQMLISLSSVHIQGYFPGTTNSPDLTKFNTAVL